MIFLSCFFILNLLCLASANSNNSDQVPQDNKRRALSVFNVVRFQNVNCVGSNKNGTCYTPSECTAKSGKNLGTCANGYGVCCGFTLSCGGTSSENCTYFDGTSSIASGSCSAFICKTNSDICALRLDFLNFIISGPSTLATTVAHTIAGNVVNAASGKTVKLVGQCLTDSFTVTGNGGGSPPVICGTNIGQHVYVDASNNCNELAFQFGQTGIGTGIGTRTWSIKVSQISCFDPNLPPTGCTQYFYGPNTGSFQSFNFGSTNSHLASQNQEICFRRERGNCRICFSTLNGMATDFSVSGMMNPGAGGGGPTFKGYVLNSACCGYGTNGLSTKGYDCVIIPGASNLNKVHIGNQLCGNRLTNIQSGMASLTTTICTTQVPFQFQFISDFYEFVNEGPSTGFNLFYSMQMCT